MNKLIKNVVVKGNLDATGTISQQIHIPFEPSSVVVKYVTYYQDGAQVIGYVNSNLLNAEDVIAPIVDGTTLNLGVEYELNKAVSGTYDFYMRNINGTIRTDLNGNIIMHLEFRKYLQ